MLSTFFINILIFLSKFDNTRENHVKPTWSGHTPLRPPPPAWGGGGGLKISEKSLLGEGGGG